jgi:hypothetical protein
MIKFRQVQDQINFGLLFHLALSVSTVQFMMVTGAFVWPTVGAECYIMVCGACDLCCSVRKF